MVLDQIKEILKDTMDIDESKITLDAKLKEDLELDSLDSVELIMSAEEEFGIEIPDEEVIAAARLANCEEFAAKLPDGYHSMIGENGCELSGGERQRISIARAFLKNAPIILLDEATASLDVENETLIQTALSTLIKDKTTLVIAHRMRTVSGADKVVVLSGGLVAEQGTPETLMNTGTIYPHMVKLQTLSRDWGI